MGKDSLETSCGQYSLGQVIRPFGDSVSSPGVKIVKIILPRQVEEMTTRLCTAGVMERNGCGNHTSKIAAQATSSTSGSTACPQ